MTLARSKAAVWFSVRLRRNKHLNQKWGFQWDPEFFEVARAF